LGWPGRLSLKSESRQIAKQAKSPRFFPRDKAVMAAPDKAVMAAPDKAVMAAPIVGAPSLAKKTRLALQVSLLMLIGFASGPTSRLSHPRLKVPPKFFITAS